MSRFLVILLLAFPVWSQVAPEPARGLYAIWSKPEISDHLSFLKGGQAYLQWDSVEPAEGRYDFSSLDRQLESLAKLGRFTTVQLNANRLPESLFHKVPLNSKAITKEQDRRGTPQYWHPAYVKAYTDVVAAFARAVKSSPYRAQVIGVRLNYDAIGTEFMVIPPDERDASHWVAPPGMSAGPTWTEEIAASYRRMVLETYQRNFLPEIRILLRTGNPQYRGPDPEALRLAGAGKFGFFTTASEIEPRMPTMFDGDTPVFLEYCRTGKTVCYAESMADATGKHGPLQDPRWCSPAQYNYWRLLSDLNLGVSMIGVYGGDLAHAAEPEYQAAFEFATRYVGYHATPGSAPGAWVALREGTGRLKGDYTFLMHRLPDPPMRPEQKAGPDDQRFGAWARTLAKGDQVRFVLDSDFARSLKKAVVRVTWLDRGTGAFTVRAAGREFHGNVGGSGRWKTAEFDLGPVSFAADAIIALQTDTDLTLHMVEVARSPATSAGTAGPARDSASAR